MRGLEDLSLGLGNLGHDGLRLGFDFIRSVGGFRDELDQLEGLAQPILHLSHIAEVLPTSGFWDRQLARGLDEGACLRDARGRGESFGHLGPL